MNFSAGDGTKNITVSQTDSYGNIATVNRNFIRDTVSPALSSVEIAGGVSNVGTNFVVVAVEASDDRLIESIRIKNSHIITDECQSEYSDDNWQSYGGGAQNYSHSLTAGDGVKKVCVWAKDSAGNVSSISPVNGSLGVDMDTVTYAIGNPPVITNLTAVNNTAGINLGTKNFNIGDQVKIDWTMTDIEELDSNPVTLQYTTSSSQTAIWTDIETDYGSIGTGQTSYTHTYTNWNAPSAGFFRIRLIAKDVAGNTSPAAEANILNTGQWSVYAGSSGRGVGGSGTATRLHSSGGNPGMQLSAVDPLTNDAYAIDSGYGIYKLDAITGKSSVYIEHGSNNLVDSATLDSSHRIHTSYSFIEIDSNGYMYIMQLAPGAANIYSNEGGVIWQIHLASGAIKKYLGGGTVNDATATASTAHVALGGFTIDPSGTIFYQAYCDTAGNFDRLTDNIKLMKVTQNVSFEADTISHVAGNCTRGAVNGETATSAPLTNSGSVYYMITDIAAWDNGNKILFCNIGICRKIINGNIYQTSFSSLGAYYHYATSTLYAAPGSRLSTIVLDEANNNGDTVTTYVESTASGACLDEGVDRLSTCSRIGYGAMRGPNGTVAFNSGAASNSPSSYSLRYVAADNKVYTYLGSPSFYGNGLNSELTKGSYAGIYYKKASEPNQVAFPEGLYFVDKAAMILGRVETTKITTIVGGNQSLAATAADGTTLSPNVSIGSPYGGGAMTGLDFNDMGLPFMRSQGNRLISIEADMSINYLNTGSSDFNNAAEGADPALYSPWVYGGYNNLSLKDSDKLFLLGAYIHPSRPGILSAEAKLFDYGASNTNHLMGDSASSPGSSADDLTGGNLASKTFHASCDQSSSCYINYDSVNDRLYFSEVNKLRFITTPENSATSTLQTLFSPSAGSIYNFIFSEDGSQLFYLDGSGKLRCYDISSGKLWCDERELGPISGMESIARGANQLAWKNSTTLLISNYRGLVYQYELLP